MEAEDRPVVLTQTRSALDPHLHHQHRPLILSFEAPVEETTSMIRSPSQQRTRLKSKIQGGKAKMTPLKSGRQIKCVRTLLEIVSQLVIQLHPASAYLQKTIYLRICFRPNLAVVLEAVDVKRNPPSPNMMKLKMTTKRRSMWRSHQSLRHQYYLLQLPRKAAERPPG